VARAVIAVTAYCGGFLNQVTPLIALVALPLLATYGWLVEPYWIETTHYSLAAPVASTLKIAHLSDIHTHGLGRREKALLLSLRAEKPDVILITGDMVSTGAKAYRQAADVYRQLDAPLGVWFVRGNWENEKKPHTYETTFYRSLDVHLLVNQSRKLRDDVWLVGLDESREGHPDWKRAAAAIPTSGFAIAMIHTPGTLHSVDQRADLVLAGDTHGGQIRLPGLKAITIAEESKPFVSGWYRRKHSLMYVSRGLGLSGPPLRLFCRPEITYINIVPPTPNLPIGSYIGTPNIIEVATN
jgi:uncharacterized protein